MPESWKGPGPEEGLEEGDIIMDYVMPVKGMLAKPALMVMNAAKGAVNAAWRERSKQRALNNKSPYKDEIVTITKADTAPHPEGFSAKSPTVKVEKNKPAPAKKSTDWWSDFSNK